VGRCFKPRVRKKQGIDFPPIMSDVETHANVLWRPGASHVQAYLSVVVIKPSSHVVHRVNI
jgi:hypothetical protein